MTTNTPEAGFKEYKNVREFPLHTDALSREELAALYAEMREEYKGLSLSRGQLVRRRVEGKQKVAELKQSIASIAADAEGLMQEREKLKRSLGRSVETQGEIRKERDEMHRYARSLREKLNATNTLIGDFEAVYEAVKDEPHNVSGLMRLLRAAKRLLTTDLKGLVMKRAEPSAIEEFKRESPADVNRRLLDE